MLSLLLLPSALLSLCAEASPIARRQLRATNSIYDGPFYNLTTITNSTCNGTDVYNLYTGDGGSLDGWPSIDRWASFDYLWAANLPLINNSCINIGTTGPNNSPEETIAVGASILSVAAATNIDPRFILAIMMQESKGCVRVQTTYGGNANPGLMQSHAGPNTCAGISPCPVEIITGMLSDGAGGTPSGDGLAAIMDELTSANATNQLSFGNDTTSEQMYYRTARIYNSGSIASTGNLGGGLGSTNCYVSDVANRLLGWVFAGSSCTAENAGAAAYTAPEAVWNGSTTNWNGTITNGNGTTTTTTAATDGCVLVQTGDTCSSIAEELGVSTEVFLQANTGIDADCTNLLAGFSYCA